MVLEMPSYIRSARVADDPITHNWDESVKEEVLLDNPKLMDQLSAISYRGLLAFSLGFDGVGCVEIESTSARSRTFSGDRSCRAATIDWRYLKSLDVPDWSGALPDAIGGPLDLAFWLLREAFVAARALEPFR